MDDRDDSDVDHDDNEEGTLTELEAVHSTLKEILELIKSRTNLSGLFWIVLLIMCLEDWPGSKLDRWTDQTWYSFRYDAEFKNVTVEKRPLNCDFLQAPLGSKSCRYKKRTYVFGEEQRRALIEGATTVEERQSYSSRPDTVNVYWEKEED